VEALWTEDGCGGGVDGWRVWGVESIKWSFSVRKNILLGYGEELTSWGILGGWLFGLGAEGCGCVGCVRECAGVRAVWTDGGLG